MFEFFKSWIFTVAILVSLLLLNRVKLGIYGFFDFYIDPLWYMILAFVAMFATLYYNRSNTPPWNSRIYMRFMAVAIFLSISSLVITPEIFENTDQIFLRTFLIPIAWVPAIYCIILAIEKSDEK